MPSQVSEKEYLFLVQGNLDTTQFESTMRDGLASFSLAIVILVAGLAALGVWRSTRKEGILLWFGLLASLYGTRQLFKNSMVLLTFGISRQWADSIVSWGDFLIGIPVLLFIEEIFGRGWRSSVRWGVWALTFYAVAGITLGLITGQRYYLPEPGVLILLPVLVCLVILNRIKRYKPPSFPDLRIALMGIGILVAFVLDEHYLPARFHAEPLGFFLFVCALGIVAIRRTVRNERRLLSMEQEMASARRIQSSILPAEAPRLDGLTIAARYSPMNSVAGDFYDFVSIDSDRLGMFVADVTGHGVPAALIASMMKVAFASQQPNADDPSLLLRGVNEIMCKQGHAQYVTAAYIVIDVSNGSAIYSAAGHPPLIVWRAATRNVERYENNGVFLGFLPAETYPNVYISISPGDRLILYTDGLLEAVNASERAFSDRIDDRIACHQDLPATAFADALLADLRTWAARPGRHWQDDDLTLLVADIGARNNKPSERSSTLAESASRRGLVKMTDSASN